MIEVTLKPDGIAVLEMIQTADAPGAIQSGELYTPDALALERHSIERVGLGFLEWGQRQFQEHRDEQEALALDSPISERSGHGAPSANHERLAEIAAQLGFLRSQFGISTLAAQPSLSAQRKWPN